MSTHPSSYQPNTKVEQWLDQRLPIVRMVHGQFVDFPTPRNLNYWWTFGGILTLVLASQILTGIVLAMHYAPTATDAFDSVERIRRDVNFGWLIRNMHAVGASMFFLASTSTSSAASTTAPIRRRAKCSGSSASSSTW